MKRKWGVPETLATVFLASMAVCLLTPVYTDQKSPGGQTHCLSNLQQLAVAMQLYVEDAANTFPFPGWLPELTPYYKSDEELTCPEVERIGRTYGYAMNVLARGANATAIDDPTKSVTLFETDALGRGIVANLAARNRDRHEGKGSNVSYADSHAKFILKENEP